MAGRGEDGDGDSCTILLRQLLLLSCLEVWILVEIQRDKKIRCLDRYEMCYLGLGKVWILSCLTTATLKSTLTNFTYFS